MTGVVRLAAGAVLLLAIGSAGARADGVLKGEYLFNNSLSSDVAGAPDLVAVNPAGLSGFVTDTVFGNPQTVYNFKSNSNAPASQAGLNLNTSGLLTSNNYSVQMIFSLTDGNNAWRRLIDSLDRQSDAGFYFDTTNRLDIFPVIAGGPTYTTGTYDNVALTVASDGTVKAYLDGTLEFTTVTGVMDIATDTLGFFLDNVVAGGQGEWSGGNIAALRVYDGVLSQGQVNALNDVVTSTVPEPASMVLVGAGLGWLGVVRRRRR